MNVTETVAYTIETIHIKDKCVAKKLYSCCYNVFEEKALPSVPHSVYTN